MAVCEELSILDLLKVQGPGYVGCLPYSSPAESAVDADPIVDDILNFVKTIIPCEAKDEATFPYHPSTTELSQDFFGISLNKDLESGLEHLTSFIQSHVNPQPHPLKRQKLLPILQHCPVNPAFTAHSTTLSSDIQHSSNSPPQLPSVNCNDQQSVLPTTQLDHLVLKTPICKKIRNYSNTPKSYPNSSNHEQTPSVSFNSYVPELELHPSPSSFFKETQKQKLFPTDSSANQVGITEMPQLVDHGPEKHYDDLNSNAAENRGIHSSPNDKECLGKKEISYSKSSQEANSSTLPENHLNKYTEGNTECQVKLDTVCQGYQTRANSNLSRYKEKNYVSPSKDRHMKPDQSSSKNEVDIITDCSKGQIKDGTSSSKDQVKNSTSSSKGQVKDSTNSGKGQVKNSTSSSKGQVKDSTNSGKGQVKNSTKSSKDQVKHSTSSSKDQVKDSTSSSKGQVKNSTSFSKDQVKDSTRFSKGQVKDAKTSSEGHDGKTGQRSNKSEVQVGPASKIDQEVKVRADSSRGQEVKNGKSSSRNVEVKATQDSSRGQVKGDPASHKCQDKNGSSSSKDPYIKAGPGSHDDQQTIASSDSSKRQKNGYHKLPFISTDEQENKDNEHPRWKEHASLSTNEERYKLARELWKNPCVPDPNKNLTIFGTEQFKTCHSSSSIDSRKRRRNQWCDMEDLQPVRKRQRRFENLSFSTNHIKRSKYQVMNEFLGNIQTPNISSQAARKLENSHKEKQYMLDLALEEVNAMQLFYDGLPNQDLTVTQEEVEMGWFATEHVYQVFGRIYGYNGQEFFP